jgi:hypothetical protein
MSLLMIIPAISSSGGGSTPPPSDYFDPVSGDITFTNSHFQSSALGLAKTGFTMRSPAGFVEFRTSETDFDVKIGGNWSGNGDQSKIYLLVDGVFNQAITLTADNTTETHSITSLASGVKLIRLVNGYAAQADFAGDINRPQAAICVQGVVTTGDIEIKKPVAPAKRIVILGMSITTGAVGTRVTDTSWAMQLRNTDGYDITLDSYGARILANNSSVFGSAQANAMVAYLFAQMDGTSSNELWIDLATNDYFFNASKATYKARLDLLVSTMQAAHPAVRIILIKPTDRTEYDTPNSAGATLGDMATAMDEIAVTYSIEKMGDRTDLLLANTVDGLHPNQTGQNGLYTARKADYLAL